ncbi:hypothetical protein KPH14_003762 [Odynerus spinipes]|uniref:phospholipase A1 n=1 Tax=Odynerus spinipes TaxID=1348599 RepID=A0AAD9RXM0_9HYME|nr:hypothetical protein KPH14_003762 [Odynerus spinipes]
MQTHFLIGFAFFCIAAGLPVKEDGASEFRIGLEDIRLLNQNLYVFDDDNQLVPLESNLPFLREDEESEADTLLELHNRVFFYLYSTQNPKNPTAIFIDDKESVRNSNFDFKRPTRVVTHGWMNSRNSEACTLIRDAYLKHDDYNVIVIDWSKISTRPYIFASSRVKMVGQYVAKMLDFLVEEGLDLSTTTMVGHSLGAHVVGLGAHYAKSTVNYVVGLDPALPGFATAGVGSRISKGDASYVEIIHTNAGLLGYLSSIGDSDFYPNGGSKQVGCIIDIGGACSHSRSYHYFAESINSPVGFHAKECENYLQFKLGACNHKTSSLMGEHKKIFMARGTYYLETNAIYPYAKSK